MEKEKIKVDLSWGGEQIINVHGDVKWIDRPFKLFSHFHIPVSLSSAGFRRSLEDSYHSV